MKPFKYLKKNYTVFLIALLLAVTSCSFTTKKIDPGENDTKQEVLSELVTFVLKNYHFAPKDINDEFSKSVYKEYLKSLDPRKRFFLKSDIEEFEQYKMKIDDQIKAHSVEFFKLTYNRLQQRMKEMRPLYQKMLEQPFNFNKTETINTDYKELKYPATKKERKDRWQKQLKFSTLVTYYDLKEQKIDKLKNQEEDNKESLTKSTEEEKQPLKTDAELEKEARKTTRHSLKQFYEISEDLEESDWFSMYLNAIAKEFDPHTGYFAPPDKENFDIMMSGSLEGIGAQLTKDMENIKVVKLISGGPAWSEGQLEVGDIIKKVKQEDEKKPVSIVGMSITDAVQLIRGPKGSVVTLTVKKVDGTSEIIKITRDVVHIEATYAKSALTTVGQKTYGIIRLPSFYFNMKDYEKRNAATDMQKQIEYLKTQDIDGLIVDLRNNGGGSLSTAIDIGGLFIKKGPIVQVRSGNDNRQILKDRNAKIEWNGSLVILVNELSASASEILAAAMQDYNRAVILGSQQTYGKGTVQKFINLDRFMRTDELGKMGAIKITTQKFYRINGGATQLKGVTSDVTIPDRYSYIDIGERDMEAPLPWDKIQAADYNPWDGYTNFDKVVKKSEKRVSNSQQFALIKEHAQWIKTQRNQNVFPLSYKNYKTKVEETKKQSDEFEAISDYSSDLTFKSLPREIKQFKTDSTLAEKRKRWHENLSHDAYVEEAVNILQHLKLRPDLQKKLAKAKKD